jgi:hypothetical protein
VNRSAITVLTALLLGACATPVPIPPGPQSPLATVQASPPEPSPAATPIEHRLEVRLFTTLAEHCGSIGGCAAYASIGFAPPGGSLPATPETRLSMLGDRQAADGLPSTVTPGPHVARFRLVAVSDDRTVGQDPDEVTLGTCEVAFDGTGGRSVTIDVVFRGATCEATAEVR